jgi:hypothetical protein
VSPVRAQDIELQARVEVIQSGTNFSYTVFNDEPVGSSRHLNIWHLELNAPFRVTATPAGWNCATDNASYVDWFSTDGWEPYVHDIAPGTSLPGFRVAAVVATSENFTFAANSWEHGTTNSGPLILSSVKASSILSFAANIVDVSFSSAELQFRVQGIPSLGYAVEVSSNLVDWNYVTSGTSPFTFIESPPTRSGARFFRVVYTDWFGDSSDGLP